MNNPQRPTWLHVRNTRQFVDGRLVGVMKIPTVFIQLGPILVPMSLSVAERVQEELFAVIEHLRVAARTETERN